MGIYDRDYMRRGREDPERVSTGGKGSADARLEAVLKGLLRRYPRLPMVLMGLVLALILAGLAVVLLSG